MSNKPKNTPKLKCPNCGAKLEYLNVPRTSFTYNWLTGEAKYETIKNRYQCPFCDYGIAGDEELAIHYLKEGRFGIWKEKWKESS